MGFPQQLPAKIFFILSTPIFIRHFYGNFYWFVSNLLEEFYYWLEFTLIIPQTMMYDFLLLLLWNVEMVLSTFLSIVLDYTEVVVYLGLLLYIYKLLLQLSITLKALKKFISNPVSWLRGYLRNKYLSRYGRFSSLYRLKNLFNRIFRN